MTRLRSSSCWPRAVRRRRTRRARSRRRTTAGCGADDHCTHCPRDARHPGLALQARPAGQPVPASLDSTAIGPDGAKTVDQGRARRRPEDRLLLRVPDGQPAADPEREPRHRSRRDRRRGRAGVRATRRSAACTRRCTARSPIAGRRDAERDGRPIAFQSLLSAWKDYLARYNDGRGIVLIGHSQGAFLLQPAHREVHRARRVGARADRLGDPARRQRDRADRQGRRRRLQVPAARATARSQTGCVIAYSSFDHDSAGEQPVRPRPQAGEQVLCTNPAALGGGSGPVDPVLPGAPHEQRGLVRDATGRDDRLGRLPRPVHRASARTWAERAGSRSPTCASRATTVRPLVDALGPTWGLHIYDGNIALGNLVDIVRSEAGAWHSGN